MGIERSTFIIDEKGKIIKIFRKVKTEGHAEEVLDVLKDIWIRNHEKDSMAGDTEE